jgi:hypothetical protein
VLKNLLVSLLLSAVSVGASANIITGSAVLRDSSPGGTFSNPIAHPINISWRFSTIGSTNIVASVDAFSLVIGGDVFSASNTTVTPTSSPPGGLQLVDIRGSGNFVTLFSAQIYTGAPGGGVQLFYRTQQTGVQSFISMGQSTETITPSSVPIPSSIALALVGFFGLLGASSKAKRATIA